ncbi:uncharacterized protein TNCT_651041 [Trichonephila clavata]|uniref:Uncharacterized protein n=1 Tax=Trichonephila clavata TaxID=2740835 RepID=A0A8X6G5Y5_TRICU|nr:uncharacterized protein TNCT_651041 [Trichonephila clavata]
MSEFNSPNSCHIFNDSEISDDDGDLNIPRSSCNRKRRATSSLSCESNLFIDENIHSESKKTRENKRSYHECSTDDSEFDSSPLPPFVTHSTESNDSYEDYTECAQVDQSNVIKASHLEFELKVLSDNLESNCAFNNPVVDLGILTHKLVSLITVKDFLSHHNTCSILSKLCFENDSDPFFYMQKYPEINGDFEKFLNCSALSLIEKYAKDIIFDMFPKMEKLGTNMISTNAIFQYVYEKCSDNEALYVTRLFCGGQFLKLEAVISKFNFVGLMLIYDDFKKGNKHWRNEFSNCNV